MTLQSKFYANALLNTSSMQGIKGGKRVLEAARSSQQGSLVAKAERKADRRLSRGTSGSFAFFFEGQPYNVTYDASSSMLHVYNAAGEEICVEW